MPNLAKCALVTGASRGIGRAIGLALARDGARVLAHYGSNATHAEALAAQIRAMGGEADILQADLATVEGPAILARQVEAVITAPLDILVCNAGIAKAAAAQDLMAEDFDQLFATNVRGPALLLKHLLPLLAEGASIVLLSSLAGRSVPGNPGQVGAPLIAAYGATKGAVDTLVRHWASELGLRGIRVNAVAPGVIATDMGQSLKTEAGRELNLGMQALKRVGQPEDVADVVAFLVSDKARWITGVTLPVDGGAKL